MNRDNNIPNNNSGAVSNNGGSTGVVTTNSAQVVIESQSVVDPIVTNVAVSVNPNVIICPKCGSEMKRESRYCMKCGNLNYAHPENESMKKYAWQNIKQGYFISGANVDNKQPLSMNAITSVSDINPFKSCLITNIILHIVLLVLMIAGQSVIYSNFGSSLPVGFIIASVIGVVVGFLINYSTQAMYIKAGEPWWGYLVPFYNNYIFYKIALGNGWLFLTLIIPIVGIIVNCVAFYNLGKKFYKSGWFTLFFPFVMIPIIGLSKEVEYSMLAKDSTLSENNINVKGKTESERIYGRNKFILTTIILVIIVVTLYFSWPYLQPLAKKLYVFFMEQIEFLNNS